MNQIPKRQSAPTIRANFRLSSMNKKSLSERDICTKFITPNLVAAGWDLVTQIREEVGFTDGRIYVRGKIHTRGAKKRVDHILWLFVVNA